MSAPVSVTVLRRPVKRAGPGLGLLASFSTSAAGDGPSIGFRLAHARRRPSTSTTFSSSFARSASGGLYAMNVHELFERLFLRLHPERGESLFLVSDLAPGAEAIG